MPEVPRAKKGFGFFLAECWGWALSLPRDDPAWPACAHLYEYAIDVVRIMTKLGEFHRKTQNYDRILAQAERAKELDVKVHLCIDAFNTASGPGSYHRSFDWGSGDLVGQVKQIIRDFDPWLVEVINEPYYAKDRNKRLTQPQYNEIVHDYIRGARASGWTGPILATQSRKDPPRFPIKEGWEWDIWPGPESQSEGMLTWEHGLLEGKHTMVLHEERSVDDSINKFKESYVHNVAVGWRYPAYDSEWSATGTVDTMDTQSGSEKFLGVIAWAKNFQLPICHLQMYSDRQDWQIGGDWRMATHLVDNTGTISRAGRDLLTYLGQPQFDRSRPVTPPLGPPESYDGHRILKRAERLCREAREGDEIRLGKVKKAHGALSRVLKFERPDPAEHEEEG